MRPECSQELTWGEVFFALGIALSCCGCAFFFN